MLIAALHHITSGRSCFTRTMISYRRADLLSMIPSEPYALGESTPELIAAAASLFLAAAHALHSVIVYSRAVDLLMSSSEA